MKRKISNIRLNNRSASNYFLNRLGSNNSNERAGQVYSIIVDLLIAEFPKVRSLNHLEPWSIWLAYCTCYVAVWNCAFDFHPRTGKWRNAKGLHVFPPVILRLFLITLERINPTGFRLTAIKKNLGLCIALIHGGAINSPIPSCLSLPRDTKKIFYLHELIGDIKRISY